MSRRRGEFEHRTSIFEGSFRAWSHLGGLAPEDVESKATVDLDPLVNPLEEDPRVASQRKSGELSAKEAKNPDGSTRREYPYEPLPRSGLAHPYVQAILSPWLGPDADNEAIQLGLTTLRTWWQHRRKGESGSAIAALGTEKMKGVVEGYTRHFFTLAHCLVVNDKEQPPRTLHGRMKELEKARNKRNKKSKNNKEEDPNKASLSSSMGSGDIVNNINGDLTDSNLSPLERLHAAQQRQLASTGMVHPTMPATSQVDISQPAPPIIDMKGKCIPGKIDLPGMMEQVNHAANQLAHRGGAGMVPSLTSSANMGGSALQQQSLQQHPMSSSILSQQQHQPAPLQQMQAPEQYGDPNTSPIVFMSSRREHMIALEIDGITCAHCVKIVETVLKGCSGNKSPIEGLLDAAADQGLSAVLIKIDKPINAKRVAFEATRNLSMVGYTARPKEMSILGADKKSTTDLESLSTAFEVVGNSNPTDIFDWRVPCTCPDNGVLRTDCSRHGQMNPRIFEVFEARRKQMSEYILGGGVKFGMACTCGPGGRGNTCPLHGNGAGSGNGVGEPLDNSEEAQILAAAAQMQQPRQLAPAAQPFGMGEEDEPIQIEQPMNLFGIEPPKGMGGGVSARLQQQQHHPLPMQNHMDPLPHNNNNPIMDDVSEMGGASRRQSQRNPSIISYGGLRHMSMNSETTFGRAMSGLSALSIDWENLEEFDLEVDYSAHINNNNAGQKAGAPGARRSSIRRPDGVANQESDAHVSFKV